MIYMLYLADNHFTLSVFLPNAHSTLLCKINNDEPDALERLSDVFRECHPASVYVFLDVMGEEIKQENIPRVSRKDRQRLLARKEKSLFHNADFVLTRLLYEEISGRKDYVYLLLGISLSSINKKILDVLVDNEIEIYGLYVIAVMQKYIADMLDDDQLLIVSDNGGSSNGKYFFRQTFFKDRNLALARITAVSGEHDAEVCYQLDKEVGRTSHFLRSSRKISSEVSVRALAFMETKYAEFFVGRQDSLNIVCDHVAFSDLAGQFGLPEPESYASLPDILCHFAIQKKVKPHLEPKSLCVQRNVRLNKRKLVFAAAVVSFLAVIVSSLFLVVKSDYRHDTQDKKHVFSGLEKNRDALLSQLPKRTVEPRVMEGAVKLHAAMQENTHYPEYVFDVIASAYRGFSNLSIEEISWRYDNGTQGHQDDDASEQVGAFLDVLKKPLQLILTLSPDAMLTNREAINLVVDFKYSLLAQPSIQSIEEVSREIDTDPSKKFEESFLLSHDVSSQKTRFFTLLVTFGEGSHGGG